MTDIPDAMVAAANELASRLWVATYTVNDGAETITITYTDDGIEINGDEISQVLAEACMSGYQSASGRFRTVDATDHSAVARFLAARTGQPVAVTHSYIIG